MMERLRVGNEEYLSGYDQLVAPPPAALDTLNFSFTPNGAYAEYFKFHKVFVGERGGAQLADIGTRLADEWMPPYLDVAGWAFAESALAQAELPTRDRMALITQAETCWQRELTALDTIASYERPLLPTEYIDEFRAALNLAYTPLMKAVIAGDVTEATRERTFADTLAIAQLSTTRNSLAAREHNVAAVAEHRGFQYECVALLSILYANNPNIIPIPSSARADSGREYPEQTHDIAVIHHRWGKIHRVTPVEVKATASLHDKQRYKSLIVRGKLHLAVTGKHEPIETLNAFADIYDGNYTPEASRIADHASSTVRDLLELYQKGQPIDTLKDFRTPTSFHDVSHVAKKYAELSPYRRHGH